MKVILTFLFLLFFAGCNSAPTVVYSKNGVIQVPRSLGLDGRSSFRFVERWHINFSWLSGPFGVNDCQFGKNPFKGRSEYGELAADVNGPEWHWRNAIVGPYVDDQPPFPGKLKILVSGNLDSPHNATTLGQQKKNGEVEYMKNCSASLSESFTSATATIVNAKMHKDASSLIFGSRNVTIGGNEWRLVERPISDYPGNRYGDQPMLERWVLEIPETDYWMVFTFYASRQFSYIERREAYDKAHDLFRQAIASVTLRPIKPLVDQEKIIRPEQCIKRHPISPWICPFNKESLLQ